MHIYVFIIVFSLCLPPPSLHPFPPHFKPPHEIHLMPEGREHAITCLFIPYIVVVTPRACQAG